MTTCRFFLLTFKPSNLQTFKQCASAPLPIFQHCNITTLQLSFLFSTFKPSNLQTFKQ
jgi:hypothetical protein